MIDEKLNVVPVILCGGSGTRLWPLSRVGFPKQFLALYGEETLFQQSVRRVNNLTNSDINLKKILVVTNEEHRFLALEQLREIKNFSAKLLLEPIGRDSAPAVTIAALEAIQDGDDPVLVVTPADQIVDDISEFKNVLQKAIKLANTGEIVILGITPSRPETAYGYIQRGSERGIFEEYCVTRFVEKPDLETARKYISTNDYLWNSGVLILKANVWLQALKKFRSDILLAAEKAWSHKQFDNCFVRPNNELFAKIPSESIDFAILEKCPGSDIPISMLPLNVGWSDLGAWDAVWAAAEADVYGNVKQGDVIIEANTNNTYVHASSRLVGVVGVSNLVIIETADAVLVVDKKETQQVKKIIKRLDDENRREKNLHRKVYRPWGWYDTIDEDSHFKVKRIHVNPGATLSLQKHQHRSEHWVIVKGIAEVTNGNQISRLVENQSTFIPKGEIHRLKNLGNTILEIIEVQTGEHLDELDIVRFEDNYGRV